MAQTCEKCGGSGIAPDAEQLKMKRLTRGIKQNVVAKQMGVTASYLADLENGRRDWNADLVARFEKALK